MKKIILVLIAFFFFSHVQAQKVPNTTLANGFQTPPNAAKARTWWHWLSGNVSKAGITADLEAMKQVGIQEAQIFNVHIDLPKGQLKYGSPQWLDLFHFAATEAKRLGMELAFHNSAGWSSSGGPWITPANAMQKVVFSQIDVTGGTTIRRELPKPESKLNFYKDIKVLAFPKPKDAKKIKDIDFKSLSGRIRNHLLPAVQEIESNAVIDKASILDISSKMTSEGVLNWDAPKGEWIILRLGHTPTGKTKHPAIDGGVGLECDKMSIKAVDAHWKGGIQPIIDKLGSLIGTTVNNCIIDSYEVGTTNWTTGFDTEFEKLRGYNMVSYLPTLAGYYVDSAEISERFLWDFRRTIGDLMAQNYYSHFGDLCHKNNMNFSVEPYWGPFDNMQVGATGDIVMCEFWSGGYPFFDSPKFVSSIAHLSGKHIVGAESFTGIGGWDEHPAVLKSIGDRAWAEGINRFIFHTYVHQPWNVGPGLALSYHGTDFNRLNTWWTQSKSYMDYIARSQFLLQQGKNVADVLVFTGESSPNDAFLMPEIKTMGYDYDLIGANKLTDIRVENGKLYTSHSGPYEVLVLTNTSWMKPETIQIVNKLVLAGAKIIGSQPHKSPSLQNYPACDEEVATLGAKLWEKGAIQDISVVDFLNKKTIPVDFIIEKGNATDINFNHRKIDQTDIYFVANAQKESREITASFRVKDKQPEIWNAQTGTITELAVWKNNPDGTVSIPLTLESEGAFFVVFRKPIGSNVNLTNVSWKLDNLPSEPLSNLKIIKAEYGTFLQEGLIDITDKVQAELKENQLDFSASRQFCDCDPAMGYVKEFRLEYQLGDKINQITAAEKEQVLIKGGEKELKVIRALFGKFKPETKGVPKNFKTYEVTDKINALVNSGNRTILVNEKLIEGKTIDGDKRSLKITFSTDGEERALFIPEGQFLNLSQEIPKPKVFIENGKQYFSSPFSGTLTYTKTTGEQISTKVKNVPEPIVLKDDWKLRFSFENKAALNLKLDKLISWSESTNPEIRYFSGTASYKNEFKISKKILQGNNSLELDLGNVAVIAEVFINGKNAGTFWKAPFRVPISDFVNKGKNTIEIKVTNLWPNKLIGDEQLPLDFERNKEGVKEFPQWLLNNTERPSKRTTFSSWKHYSNDSKLLPSGLLGPVRIYISEVKVLN